jgi:hypothetical protein
VRAHGRVRHAQHARDLARLALLEEAQQDRGAVRLVEIEDGFDQAALQLGALDEIVSRRLRLRARRPFLASRASQLRAPASTRPVGDDRSEPGAQRSARRAGGSRDQRILRDVVGRLRVLHQARGQRADPAGVLEEGLDGGGDRFGHGSRRRCRCGLERFTFSALCRARRRRAGARSVPPHAGALPPAALATRACAQVTTAGSTASA